MYALAAAAALAAARGRARRSPRRFVALAPALGALVGRRRASRSPARASLGLLLGACARVAVGASGRPPSVRADGRCDPSSPPRSSRSAGCSCSRSLTTGPSSRRRRRSPPATRASAEGRTRRRWCSRSALPLAAIRRRSRARRCGARAVGLGLVLLLLGSIVASGSRGALAAAFAGLGDVRAARCADLARARHRRCRRRRAAGRERPELARLPTPTRPSRRAARHRRRADRHAATGVPRRERGLPLPGGHRPSGTVRTAGQRPNRSQPGSAAAAGSRRGGVRCDLAADRPVVGYGFGTENEVFVDRYFHHGSNLPENSYVGHRSSSSASPASRSSPWLAGSAPRCGAAPCAAPPERSGRRGSRRPAPAAFAVGLVLALTQSFVYSAGQQRDRGGLALRLPRCRRSEPLTDVRAGLTRRARPRLLVLNQYYWPGVEATAHLLSELCAALADEFDVTVVTGRVDRGHGAPGRVDHERRRDRPRRARPRTTAAASRCARSTTSPTSASRSSRALRAEPPRRRPLHDRPAGDRRRRTRRRAPLRRAARRRQPGRVPRGRRRAEAARQPGARGRAARGDPLLPRAGRPRRRDRRHDAAAARGEGRRPRARRRDPELGRHGRARRRVRATTSGRASTASTTASSSCTRATSATRRTSTRSSAPATFLRDLDRLTIVLIGGGARRDELKRARQAARGRPGRRSWATSRATMLPLSLSAADVHVVGLARGLSGYVVPSRLYGILAVGRPVIVAADADSETAQVVERAAAASSSRPAGPSCSPRDPRSRTTASSTSRRWARAGASTSTRGGRPERRGRRATARCCAS